VGVVNEGNELSDGMLARPAHRVTENELGPAVDVCSAGTHRTDGGFVGSFQSVGPVSMNDSPDATARPQIEQTPRLFMAEILPHDPSAIGTSARPR